MTRIAALILAAAMTLPSAALAEDSLPEVYASITLPLSGLRGTTCQQGCYTRAPTPVFSEDGTEIETNPEWGWIYAEGEDPYHKGKFFILFRKMNPGGLTVKRYDPQEKTFSPVDRATMIAVSEAYLRLDAGMSPESTLPPQ